MRHYEGEIDIPLEEFWVFVSKFCPAHAGGDEVAYGVPRVAKENDSLTISFAASNSSHPSEWVEKPAAVREWDSLK